MKLLLLAMLLVEPSVQGKDYPLALDQFRVRDPFILPVPSQGIYYLFGTGVAEYAWGRGIPVYTSRDLVNWAGPQPAFQPPADFPTINLWAPEVHPYKGKYYMFATLKLEGKPRGTHILVADQPEGPYTMRSRQPITPPDWYCLDGTFHLDENEKPWMVFCHEWVQTGDGEICAIPLNDDLSAPAGDPVLLLKASAVPWVTPQDVQRAVNDAIQKGPETKHGEKRASLVTDGPFLYRTRAGALLMLWSTFGNGGYNVVVARSQSGKVTGPWTQEPDPLFSNDGGHAMVFRTFDGPPRAPLMMALHQPNSNPNERTRIFQLDEQDGRLTLRPVPRSL